MPENISTEVLQFSRSVKDKQKKIDYFLPVGEMKASAEESNLDFMGSGAECAVVAMRNGEFKNVVALRYHDISEPKKAKETYYLHRIFSTLFPHNFPHFKASFAGNDDGLLPGTVRQRIDTNYKNGVKYPFSHVRDFMQTYEVDDLVMMDSQPINLDVGIDGGQYYMDTIHARNGSWKKEDFTNYMTHNKNQNGENYTEKDIQTVSRSIDRLSQLGIIHTE